MRAKMTRRQLLRSAAVAGSGVVLAACQPKVVEKIVKETVVVTEEKVVEKVVKETVVVDAQAEKAAAIKGDMKWDTFRGIGTGWNEERIATFKDKYPNVDIELRPLAGSSQQDNYAKMYAMHAAGNLGDIVAFDPSHYQFWRSIEKDIIMPLGEMVEAENFDLSQWFKTFIDIQSYKGKFYGLPSWGWTGWDSIIINAVHFEEAGVDLPDPLAHDTSMETIGEWARKFKTGDRWGLSLTWRELFAAVICRCFDSYFVNEDGTKCLLLEDEKAQEAMKWCYDLSVVDKVIPKPDALAGNFSAAQIEGKLTMSWSGSLGVRNYKRDTKGKEDVAKPWQVLFPTRTDGAFPCQIRGGTWNVGSTTKSPDTAWEFLKHITSTEGCVGFNLVAGNGALVRPDVLEILIAKDEIHKWFLPNLNNGIPARPPANSRGREYTDAVLQWMGLMMDPDEQIPFEKGLQDLNDQVQKVLDKEMP